MQERSRDATITSFETPWDKRNLSEMWRPAYRLSGRLVGPNKRVYSEMAASNLGVQECAEFLSLVGYQGGSGAQVANRQYLGGSSGILEGTILAYSRC